LPAPVKHGLLAAAAYTALALAVTWPLAIRLSAALPHDAYDPALVTWVLWWDAHTRPFTEHWWNAPMFWPMTGALALSEHLVGISLFTTPLQWLGLTPVASYNVAFIASFPLAALAFHALIATLTGRHDAAALGAVAFGFGPYRLAQVAHLQMLWTFGVPLALLALHRHSDTRQTRWLVLFAIAWSLQALANSYLLLFVPVLIVMWAAWFARDARHLAEIGVAWLGGSLPLLPIVGQYERWLHALSVTRRYEEIQAFSADILSIASAAPGLTLWGRLLPPGAAEDQFFPGLVVLVLIASGILAATANTAVVSLPPIVSRLRQLFLIAAIAATAAALSTIVVGPWAFPRGPAITIVSVTSPEKPLTVALVGAAIYALSSAFVVSAWRRRSAFAFYVIAAAVTFVLALGPLPRFGGRPLLFHTLYWWLMQMPGFSNVRVPARFGVLCELSLVCAASIAFARLTATRSARARIVIAAAAIAVIVVEGWPAIPMAALPPPLAIAFDRSDRPAVLELPIGAVETDSAALARSLQHQLPIVNGYSGYEPLHYTALRLALDSGDERALDSLARDRDLIVAVDRQQDRREGERWSALVSRYPRATHIGGDPSWELYRIGRSPPPAGIPSHRSLPIEDVRTSDHLEHAWKLVDGTTDTVWTSGRPQAGREEVELDFGRETAVAALTIELGAAAADFPRRLEVECATTRDQWQPCWSGSAAALAIDGLIANPRDATMTIPIGADHLRWLRLRQRGADHRYFWSIAELTAFAR